MSCSCTANCDLINIEPLVLSDTFHTWYDRTNEIINTLNPIQLYDINVGMTDGGLTSQSTCVGGNTTGVVTLKVNPGPGIGVGTTVTPNYFLNRTMVDVSNMTIVGATGYSDANVSLRPLAAFPSNDDWFIVSDDDDASLGSGAGTPKRVKAEHMLPPTMYLPPGFQFNGNISINGNLSIQGTASNVDSNDLRIEDKVIEIAFHRLVSLDVTGPTHVGTFPAQGMTFHYYDPGVGSTADYTTVGQISEVNFNGATTNLKLHNFSLGGVNDIVSGGRLSITGSFFDFTMVAGPTTTEAFFSDIDLDEAGIVVRGSQGDKQFLWVHEQGPSPVTYNAFVTNTNLGISGDSNAIISSRFKAFGYNNSNDNKFHFVGHAGASASIRLGGLGTGSDQYGYWSITRENYGLTTTQQPLVFGFKQHGDTGEATSFTVWSGASGPTYAPISVSGQGSNQVKNFAHGLNVDFLDGAHATTVPTAWSIPVAGSSGRIDPGWTVSDSIGKCYNIVNHGFKMGDAVRLNGDNGSLTGAIATNPQNAEALGIVSSVADVDNFCIVTKGYVSGITGTAGSNIFNLLPLVAGNAYFLSPDTQGALIANPDTGANAIEFGEVRKPMFVALSADSCYVHNYLGVLEGIKTDIVDVSGVHPVGTIVPFSGEIADIPLGWLLCDGSRREKSTWSELYSVVKQNYYAEATIANIVPGVSAFVVVVGGDRNLQVNDAVRIDFVQEGVLVSVDTNITAIVVASQVYSVNNTNGGFNNIVSTTGKIYGRTNTEQTAHTSIFFVPDFRSRVGIGASTSANDVIVGATLGIVGGVVANLLTVDNIPSHSHRLKNASVAVGNGDLNGNVGFELNDEIRPNNLASFFGHERTTAFGQVESGTTSPVSTLQPYIALHWIIRAYKGMSAMILSGHNHYDRHIRYDDTHNLTDGNRSLFRTNARVLRRDGDDTFHGKLTITGGAVVGVNGSSLLEVLAGASFGGGATFNGAFAVSRPSSGRVEVVSGLTRLRVVGNQFSDTAIIADILIDNGISGSTGWTALTTIPNAILPADAAIKIRGGSSERASIALFNDNANGGTSDRADVRFFGRSRNNSNIVPIYAGGVYGSVQIPALNSADSLFERKLTLEVGMSASAAFPLGRTPVLELATNGDDEDNVNVPTITVVNGLTVMNVNDGALHNYVVISNNGKLKMGSAANTATSLSNSSSGGPNFLANGPIRILSIGVVGGSVSSSFYHNFTEIILPKDDEGLDIVPNTATALILESHLYSNGTSSVQLQIAKNTSTHPYPYLINAISAGSGADAQTAGGQSTIPFDYTAPNSKIYWRLYHPLDGTNDLNGWINLVGYY